MERRVRLGARLFPIKIISCCLLEEGVPPLICSIAFFHVGTDYVGFQHRRHMEGSADMDGITRELRIDKLASLTIRTGLADLYHTSLLVRSAFFSMLFF